MPDTDRQALNESFETAAAKIPTKSRTLPFVAQVAGIAALFAAALFGFAWWRTGSAEHVWPCLRGDCLVFESTRIDFVQVPKTQILERQIRVVNLSSKPLTLLGSQRTCECMSLDEFPVVVPADKPHV